MERRHILLEDSDGTDVSFMGYAIANIRSLPVASLTSVVEETLPAVEPITLPTQPAPTSEKWWHAAWRILNTDIFELWRTYGSKSIRRG